MSIRTVVVAALALVACASPLTLGSNTDAAPDVASVETGPPPDVSPPPDVPAPGDGAPVDAPVDAPDVPRDAPDVPASVCDEASTGTITLGERAPTLDPRRFVSLPPPSCADDTIRYYNVTRLQVDRRTGVRFDAPYLNVTIPLRASGVIAVRRVCDDPASEVACLSTRTWEPFVTVLDPGRYDVIVGVRDLPSASEPSYVLRPLVWPTPPGPEVRHDRCADAIPVGPHTVLSLENLARATEPRAGCLPAATGPALYYRAEVPVGHTLHARVSPGASPSFAPTIRVLRDCAATTCLGAAAASSEALASVNWTNDSGATASVVLVVASTAETGPNTFQLGVDVLPETPAPPCASASVLTPGVTLRDQTFVRATPTTDACGGTSSARTLFYRARVPARQALTVYATAPVSDSRAPLPTLTIQSACGDAACLAPGALDAPPVSPSVARYENDSDAAREVIVAVRDDTSVGGAFDLVATALPYDDGTCRGAARVPPNVSLYNLTTRGSPTAATTCAGAPAGPARFFTTTIPPRTGLLVVAGGLPPGVLIRVQDSCDAAPTCPQWAAGVGMATVRNESDAPRDVTVSIANQTPGADMRFTLSFATQPLSAGTTCEGAPRITGDDVLRGLTAQGPGAPVACSVLPNVPVRNHRVVVPAHHALQVEAQGNARALSLLTSCGATTCAARDTMALSGTWLPRRISWANDADTPVTVRVAVGIYEDANPDTYDLFVTMRPLTTASTCEAPTPLAPGAALVAQDLAGVGQSASLCNTGNGIASPQRYYVVRALPPGHTLTVEATGNPSRRGRWTPRVVIPESCAPSSACVGLAEVSYGRAAVVWTNTTSIPRDVTVAVGTSDFVGETFDLRATVAPAPANLACASPLDVTDGTTLRGVALPNAASSYVPSYPAIGPFYRAEVAAGHELVVVASADVLIQQLRACSDGNLAQSAYGRQRALRYVNTGAAPAAVLLRVTRVEATSVDLSFSIRRPAYAVTTVAARCDAMAADRVIALRGDEAVSAPMALAAPVPFYGQTMTHLAVSTNGFAQLMPDPTGTPSVGFAFTPPLVGIPSPSSPPGLVAPWWTDLNVTPTSDVRVAAFDAPARHTTVQWTDVALNGRYASLARLTFQAQLYADGAIEMHYCRLGSFTGRPVNPLDALIGIQSPSGVEGVRYGATSAEPVTADRALRFARTR